MTPEDEIAAELLRLELQLMDPVFRRDRFAVAALLANDFREFGASGRVWSRETIIEMMATEPEFDPPVVEDFSVQRIAPLVALATYRAVRPGGSSLRSSLWIQQQGEWKMIFHQGTRVPQL